MTYVVIKMIKGNPYKYLVRSVREGDRVRQVFVRYLGRAGEGEGADYEPEPVEREIVERPVAVAPIKETPAEESIPAVPVEKETPAPAEPTPEVVEPLVEPKPTPTPVTKKAWEMTREEFIANPPEGYSYDPDLESKLMGHRALRDAKGKSITTLGDTFFKEPDLQARKILLKHEEGHDLMRDFNRDWKDVLEPFRLDKDEPISIHSRYDNPFGASDKPEEIVADAYASLWEKGFQYEDPNYPANLLRKQVTKAAISEGKPVPPEVLNDYPELKPTTPEITPESLGQKHGIEVEIVKGEESGEWAGGIARVDDDTTLVNYKAGDWTSTQANDFISQKQYPANVVSAAHEITHGLFSKNPERGHSALQELQKLGIPENVAFESLVDLGGLYLLEPDSITKPELRNVIETWISEKPTTPVEEKPVITPIEAERGATYYLGEKATVKPLHEAMLKFAPQLEDDYKEYVTATFKRMQDDLGIGLKGVHNSAKWAMTWRAINNNFKRDTPPNVYSFKETEQYPYSVNTERLNQNAKKYGKDTSLAWYEKMQEKLGDIEGLEVSEPDQSGYIAITGERGEDKITLNQQRIINVSSRGLLFHQFPSRIYVNDKFKSEAEYQGEQKIPKVEKAKRPKIDPNTRPRTFYFSYVTQLNDGRQFKENDSVKGMTEDDAWKKIERKETRLGNKVVEHNVDRIRTWNDTLIWTSSSGKPMPKDGLISEDEETKAEAVTPTAPAVEPTAPVEGKPPVTPEVTSLPFKIEGGLVGESTSLGGAFLSAMSPDEFIVHTITSLEMGKRLTLKDFRDALRQIETDAISKGASRINIMARKTESAIYRKAGFTFDPKREAWTKTIPKAETVTPEVTKRKLDMLTETEADYLNSTIHGMYHDYKAGEPMTASIETYLDKMPGRVLSPERKAEIAIERKVEKLRDKIEELDERIETAESAGRDTKVLEKQRQLLEDETQRLEGEVIPKPTIPKVKVTPEEPRPYPMSPQERRKAILESRIKRGEPVPDKLLAEFPDLKVETAKPEIIEGDFVRLTIKEPDGKSKSRWFKLDKRGTSASIYTPVNNEGNDLSRETKEGYEIPKELISHSLIVKEEPAYIDKIYGTLKIGQEAKTPVSVKPEPPEEAEPTRFSELVNEEKRNWLNWKGFNLPTISAQLDYRQEQAIIRKEAQKRVAEDITEGFRDKQDAEDWLANMQPDDVLFTKAGFEIGKRALKKAIDVRWGITPMSEASGEEIRARKGVTTKKINKRFYDKFENYLKEKGATKQESEQGTGEPVSSVSVKPEPELEETKIDEALRTFEKRESARIPTREEYTERKMAEYKSALEGSGFPIDVKKQTEIINKEYDKKYLATETTPKPETNIKPLLSHLRTAPQSKSTESYLRKTFGDEVVDLAHQDRLVTRTPKGIYTITVSGRETIKNIPEGKVNLYAEGKRILSEGITMQPETPKNLRG